jgi:hypothetical protein
MYAVIYNKHKYICGQYRKVSSFNRCPAGSRSGTPQHKHRYFDTHEHINYYQTKLDPSKPDLAKHGRVRTVTPSVTKWYSRVNCINSIFPPVRRYLPPLPFCASGILCVIGTWNYFLDDVYVIIL